MSVVIKQATRKILKGTDPEIFAPYYKVVDGKKIPFALPPYYFRKVLGVPASDDPRHPVFLESDSWKFHEDGAAFEMSVRPSFSHTDLFDTIQDCVNTANSKIISQFLDQCDLLQFIPTINWEIERWQFMGPDFHMSTRFGCDPDNDAWGTRRESVEDAKVHPYRYSGGHIHWSGSPKIREETILAVKCQALTSGCAGVAFSHMPEEDKLRVYRYGKPGKYRIQNYGKDNPFGSEYQFGLEYRTLSSGWAGNKDLCDEVFKWGEIGITQLLDTSLGLELVEELQEVAQEAIMTYNRDLAMQVLSRVESRL